MATHKIGVYIGRFQPLHNGHVHVITQALQKYDSLLILIGSAGRARTIKNPFTASEREVIIRKFLHTQDQRHYKNVAFYHLRDQPYNDSKWIQNVQDTVNEYMVEEKIDYAEVTLLGSDRDSSTWYLHAFPQWGTDFTEPVPQGEEVNATKIRALLFERVDEISSIRKSVPEATLSFLEEFKASDKYHSLWKEYHYIKNYKKSWEAAPYAPTFVTVDSVVIQSGHVLVVKRRAEPGKGLWALPGGFVEQDERLQNAAIRELIEETKISVTPNILKGSIRGKEIFDLPDRSLRGRTITTAFLFRLDDTKPLPKVKGSDDAEKAFWLPISSARANSENWFEDHLDILETMLGMLKD